MTSCPSVLGLVLVVLTLLGAAISLGTSTWIEGPKFHAGLWQECHGDKCTFINVNRTDLPKWFNPVRIVISVSVANAIVALMVAMGYLCCSCCRYSIRALQFLIIVLVVGCLEIACSMVVYTVKHKDVSYLSGSTPADVTLGWSFYLAVGAALLFILDIIFFVCETSNARARVQYQPIRPTEYIGSRDQYQPIVPTTTME